jgi:DNA replication protein DnaC
MVSTKPTITPNWGGLFSIIRDTDTPPDLSEHPSQGKCTRCNCDLITPFHCAPLGDQFAFLRLTECDPCEAQTIAATRARLDAERQAERRVDASHGRYRDPAAKAAAMVPPDFQDALDASQLPMTDPEALRTVLTWRPSPRRRNGMILQGRSRLGKTRCLWELHKRLATEGVEMEIVTMSRFALWAKRLDDRTGKSWQLRLADVDVLALDDMGKARLTPAVEDALFQVIDDRLNYRRPTLITTQHDRQAISKLFSSPEIALAVLNRMAESAVPVMFGLSKQSEISAQVT